MRETDRIVFGELQVRYYGNAEQGEKCLRDIATTLYVRFGDMVTVTTADGAVINPEID